MAKSNFDTMSTNHDVLIYIYKLLDFKDQLTLSCVSEYLKNIFEAYIWNDSYQTLAIYGQGNDFVITNHTGVKRVHLSRAVCQEFAEKYAGQVHELIVSHKSPPNLRTFKNLTHLTYKYHQNPLEDLQMMSENLHHLQNLHFYRCFGSERLEEGNFWEPLVVDCLLKMTNLKRISLENEGNIPRIKYINFCELVTKLKLESFRFDCVIQPDEEIFEPQNLSTKPIHLKELMLETTFEQKKWSENFLSFLGNFEYLQILDIRIMDVVTNEILQDLAENSRNLETLTIRRTQFKNITYFQLPPKVKDLTLCHCSGLTQLNVKQLLNTSSLVNFSSKFTYFEGTFDDFPIAANIQCLAVDGIDMSQFKLAYAENLNLKTLTWDNSGGCRNYRHIVSGDHLETCRNLEVLNTANCQIVANTLMQLKQLRKLRMPFVQLDFQWSYLRDLLKHPALRELSIYWYFRTSWPGTRLEVPPIEGFQTNIKHLKIIWEVFEMALDFWLDLFDRNEQLTIECLRFSKRQSCGLTKLINHKNFPVYLRTIDLFGYTINCSELRNNFYSVMEKIHCLDEGMNRIILCRT